ncbi:MULTISPECIES: acyl-CoA reductase [Megasphaera]|uniref:Long-chain-fatty-acyl-CoA reductase n=1 Tax=Megasphaera vaginalis (ex Srinivasan et al. 2021) TaxID=1111454 RepID=U7UMD3_9FIRM|nr:MULTISPECIES: acyl-CoA reductase [Megasphaera]ERT59628.1 long-chain-fatty-acyl-CoA reductase [Megasphaera vaginalis (ex Srinivasan et al. 2021)]
MLTNTTPNILLGTFPARLRPTIPFDPKILYFLDRFKDALEETLPNNREAKALAFWLRRKHLQSFKNRTGNVSSRLGRGMIFHIAPANVPLMAIYSFIVSLLSGNNNIVRISDRARAELTPILAMMATLWETEPFSELAKHNAFIAYDKEKTITDAISLHCDGRIIWGGDAAIQEIRTSPLPPQAIDLAFADRYSMAVLDLPTLQSLSADELQQQAHLFYNDTYEMDQNACSSPRLIVWTGDVSAQRDDILNRWWQAVAKEAVQYDLAPIKVSRKYTRLWELATTCPELSDIQWYTNRLYVYSLTAIPDNIALLALAYGQFFQISLSSFTDIVPFLDKKVQTVTTLGIDKDTLRAEIRRQGAAGGDRIVSLGEAAEFDIFWDGIQMIEYLSRNIS